MTSKILSIWLFLAFISNLAFSQVLIDHKVREKNYSAVYADVDIEMDGILNEKIWEEVPLSSTWNDLVTCLKVKYKTRFQSFWNKDYFYLGISVEDPNIVAQVTEDNQRLYSIDNTIEVFLDPGADGIDYYELQINAHNAIWQLSLNKPYSAGGIPTDPNMIEGLLTQVDIKGTLNQESDVDHGWNIEIAIPWEGLRKMGITELPVSSPWAITMARVHQNKEDGSSQFWTWTCAEASNMHLPEKWGLIYFVH